MLLPIDVLPGTSPPLFKWRQVVHTPSGSHTAECEGGLPVSVEQAVVSIISIAKQQAKDLEHSKKLIEELKKINYESTEKVHKYDSDDSPTTFEVKEQPKPTPVTPTKKGK